jgi:glycosyltransferase involved in cell wall biosynthesis
MKKILINTPNLNQTGGVAQYYNVMKLDEENNIKYFDIRNDEKRNVIFRLVSSYFTFVRAIVNCELVVLNPSLNRRSFFRDCVFAFLTKISGKHLVVFWHGWEDSFEFKIKNSFFLKNLFKNTFGKADGFVVLGEVFKKKLLTIGVKSNVSFLRETMSIPAEWVERFNIYNKSFYREKRGSNVVKLLFLSRVVREKGVYICVDMAKLLAEKYPDKQIIMHIAGDGSELIALKEYTYSNNISNVVFHGDIRGEEKYNLLSSADLFFFPTYYGEGFPNVIVEALFFGLPVISRPIAAIPDIIKVGENGYLDSGKQASDFIPYIDYFLNLEEGRMREIAIHCHNEATRLYTVSEVRRKTIEFYNTLELT